MNMFKPKLSNMLSLLVIALLMLVTGCQSATTPESSDNKEDAAAPSFTLVELQSEKEVNFPADFSGKKTALVFFSLSWPSCVDEVLQLQPVLEDWKQHNFELIIITSDKPDDMKEFMQKNNIQATVLLDSEYTASKQYRVQYIPTDILVNEQSQIDQQFVGWQGEKSMAVIEKWLKD